VELQEARQHSRAQDDDDGSLGRCCLLCCGAKQLEWRVESLPSAVRQFPMPLLTLRRRRKRVPENVTKLYVLRIR
jgi:hypothetical protein